MPREQQLRQKQPTMTTRQAYFIIALMVDFWYSIIQQLPGAWVCDYVEQFISISSVSFYMV